VDLKRINCVNEVVNKFEIDFDPLLFDLVELNRTGVLLNATLGHELCGLLFENALVNIGVLLFSELRCALFLLLCGFGLDFFYF